MPSAHGKATATFITLLDIYPTLAQLSGTALFDKLDGKSLAGVFANPGRAPPADDAAFSQYIRCHNESQPAFDNDNLCASDQDPPPPGIITIMVRVCAFLLQT